jgi:hypothetical protein
MTISRRPLIHARWIQRQYVPSYVRLSLLHSVSFGQPVVSWAAPGLPKLRKFWIGAALPCGPSTSLQSGRA